MLNYLLVPFVGLPHFGFLRLFQWITFRAAGAAVSAILLTWIVGPGIMRRLRRMRLNQVIREGTPDAHQQKGRTPTMGGLIILGATLTSTVLWARLDNRYVLIAMISMAWMGAIGFLDDYLKLKQKLAGRKNTGLVEKYKLAGQVTLAEDTLREAGIAAAFSITDHAGSTALAMEDAANQLDGLAQVTAATWG